MLLARNINFEYVDITESMTNLKRFLKIRDFDPLFESVKENNYVGIPCLVIDGKPHLKIDESLLNRLAEV